MNWLNGKVYFSGAVCDSQTGLASSRVKDHEGEGIHWEQAPSEIASLQKQDKVFAQVSYRAELSHERGVMPLLVMNLRKQAIQNGPEVLTY